MAKGVSASRQNVAVAEEDDEPEVETGFTKEQLYQQVFLAKADVVLDEVIRLAVLSQRPGTTVDILLGIRKYIGLSNDHYKPVPQQPQT